MGLGKGRRPDSPPGQKSEIAGWSADLSGGGSLCTVETRIAVRFRTPKSVGKSETQQVFVRRWTFMGVLDDGAQL